MGKKNLTQADGIPFLPFFFKDQVIKDMHQRVNKSPQPVMDIRHFLDPVLSGCNNPYVTSARLSSVLRSEYIHLYFQYSIYSDIHLQNLKPELCNKMPEEIRGKC